LLPICPSWRCLVKSTSMPIEVSKVLQNYNLLEGRFELLVVNAQHVKMVPGRKTDVRDSEWLAQLLEFGLLRRSFVPPAAQRELRDVVRYRKRLIADRAREANRVAKVLETANIKLASVVTDVLGVSARRCSRR